jgi:hypothetical protein
LIFIFALSQVVAYFSKVPAFGNATGPRRLASSAAWSAHLGEGGREHERLLQRVGFMLEARGLADLSAADDRLDEHYPRTLSALGLLLVEADVYAFDDSHRSPSLAREATDVPHDVGFVGEAPRTNQPKGIWPEIGIAFVKEHRGLCRVVPLSAQPLCFAG